jgi:hypothetical protein
VFCGSVDGQKIRRLPPGTRQKNYDSDFVNRPMDD